MENYFHNFEDFEERERQYKEKIEKLENDLDKERNIYEIGNQNAEIIAKIKNEILSKEKEIEEITNNNNKQKEQLELISHEIDKKLKKLSNTTQIVQIKRKGESINLDGDIKVKEKQISNINNIIDILQNENDKLKMKLDFISYNNGTNGKKFKIIELDKKILSLNHDIKQKKLIVQEHIKCLSIKNQILKKISLIKKEIFEEKEKNNKFKKELNSTESKYMLIKQDYENRFNNHWGITTNKNYEKNKKKEKKIFLTQREMNALLAGVDGNRALYSNLLKRLNINESNNNAKILESQIDFFLKKQKMNIIKSNQLTEEIREEKKKNEEKKKEIDKLKKELKGLKKEYNNKITDNNYTDDENDGMSEDYNEVDDDNIGRITSRLNSNLNRIKIDANQKKEDNS